mgnify:CR=1 FL=1
MLSPRYPAAVVAGNVEVSQAVVSVLLLLQLLYQDHLVCLFEPFPSYLGHLALQFFLNRVLLAKLQIFNLEVLRVCKRVFPFFLDFLRLFCA